MNQKFESSNPIFAIISGVIAMAIAGAVLFVIAAVLRRHNIFWGGAMALLFLLIAAGSAFRVGMGTTQFLNKENEPASLPQIIGGCAVGVALFILGTVVALIIGLLGSRGGLTG